MKKVYIKYLAGLLLALFVNSNLKAQTIDLGHCAMDSISKEGFELLKNQIKDARIIVLGEQQHGTAEEYEHLAIMVKFLHEEMGFNVVAQEYCFYSFGTEFSYFEPQVSSDILRKYMYWPQGAAMEHDAFFQYIDSQKLKGSPLFLAGFDSRIFAREKFKPYFLKLKQRCSSCFENEEEHAKFNRLFENVLFKEYKDTCTTKEQSFFIEKTNCILNQLPKTSSSPRDLQNAKNFVAFYKNAWNLKKHGNEEIRRYEEREKQMADNIVWLADEIFPNEKIIVRTHNGHAAKNIQSLKGYLADSIMNDATTVGSILNETYGSKCFIIGTTAFEGTYTNWSFKPQLIPKPHPNSIESKLENKNLNYAYHSLNEYGQDPIYMFFNDFNNWIDDEYFKAPFGQIFDAVFFIKTVSAPTKMVTKSLD